MLIRIVEKFETGLDCERYLSLEPPMRLGLGVDVEFEGLPKQGTPHPRHPGMVSNSMVPIMDEYKTGILWWRRRVKEVIAVAIWYVPSSPALE